MKKIITHKSFENDYLKLSAGLQKRTDQKLKLLSENLSHPSLRVKKVRGREGVYEGSINIHYRFLFSITEDAYIILRVGTHNILEK